MGLIKNFSSYQQLINEKLIIEKIERNKYSLLLESKNQAKVILNRKDVREDDPTFVELKDSILDVFKNYNYLGLMTSYIYDQNISLDEVKDLLPWLRQNSNRLSQQPLKYKKFEDLKDEIITIDNNQKVKTILNLLPKKQKSLVEGSELFKEKAIALHGLGLSKEFGSKVSKYDTKEELINYMDEFINSNSEDINYRSIKEKLMSLNSKIIVDDIDEGIIVAEIYDYNTSKELGSSNWCISTGEGSWNSYTSGSKRQFFLWDFSKEKTNEKFQIGFTVNEFGQITNIHDKFDKSLKSNLPDSVIKSLKGMDLKFDVLNFRNKVESNIENSDGDLVKLYSDQNILFIGVNGRNNLSSIISNNISSYNPFSSEDHKYKNIYLLYDFTKEPTDTNFTNIVESTFSGVENKLFIRDNFGKISFYKDTDVEKLIQNDLEEVVDLLDKKLITFLDSQEYFSIRKQEYLDNIEPYVKGKEFPDKSYNNFKTEYIDISEEKGSTGRYWLFKIGDNTRSCEILQVHDAYNYIKIGKFNYYCLIDLEETYDSPNFKRVIKIFERKCDITYGQLSSIKYSKEGVGISELEQDIKTLIQNNLIQVRKESDYRKDVSKAWRIYKEKVRSSYDSDIEEKAEALIHYLVDNGELESEDVFDEDGELIEGVYYGMFEPNDYGDSVEFYTYNINDVIGGFGNAADKSWIVVDEDKIESLAIQRVKELIDDIGVHNFNHIDLSDYIEDSFCDTYADDEDYYREVVTEDPSDYGIERTMKEGVEEQLQTAENDKEELETKKESYEGKIELIEDRISNVEDKRDDEDAEMSDKIDEYEESENFNKEVYSKMKKELIKNQSIYDRMIKRYQSLISKYEDLINELEEEIDELDELISEIEDDDNDDYWEYNEDEIESKIEDLNNDRIQDCKNDPKSFINDMGFDEDTIKSYINEDALAKDIVDMDGYGHTLNSYDGSMDEYSYNDNDYYIFRTN